MTLARPEKIHRDIVKVNVTSPEGENAQVMPDLDSLRQILIDEFTQCLDKAIANLQVGEGVHAMYRVDVVDHMGNIRVGAARNRNSPAYAEWRQAVFERDNYTCQRCGTVREGIEAHHIKPWAHFPESRYDVGNGATLCGPCHSRWHKEARSRIKSRQEGR